MNRSDIVIAAFDTHTEADAAVRKLIENGFDMKQFSVIGRGYHTEEKVVGFYTLGDRMKMWGKYGAFWGGIWGVLFGGVFVTLPVTGPLVIAGFFASAVVSAIEGAVVVGGVSALGAALFNAGISKEHIVHYEAAIQAEGFLVMAHGASDDMTRAKAVLQAHAPTRLDHHEDTVPATATEAATEAETAHPDPVST